MKLQDDNEAMSERLLDETESRKKMADKLSHERHQSQKEKEATQEVGLFFCAKQSLICVQNIPLQSQLRQHQCHVSNVLI